MTKPIPRDPVSEAKPTGKPPAHGLQAFGAAKGYGAAVVAEEARQDRKSAVTYARSPANWRGYSDDDAS